MAKYDNIPGCPGYYISKRGQIYSRIIPNGNDAGKLGKVWRERKVKIMIKTPTYSTKRVKIRNKSMINKIIRYKFKELWQGRK